MKIINLFEYENKEKVEDNKLFKELEIFLQEIWENRPKNFYFLDDDNEKQKKAQQLLQFLHKDSTIKSNNYVGVIHFNDLRINLLPKIFYSEDEQITENFLKSIHWHILWWLSYCKKIKFPSHKLSLTKIESDFFEVLIYLFSNYTKELLYKMIYQNYEEKEEELSYIKGRINFHRYISENLATGRWHKVQCIYDSFEMDNNFNRIVKYVSNVLVSVTKSEENRKNLKEILFILDEVNDVRANADDCLKIRFNLIFSEFEIVKDYCYLFLSNSISFSYKNDFKLFAFLVPMEKIFEEFVAGFLEKETDIKVTAQSKSKYLAKCNNKNIFQLRPDLIIEKDENKIIADTKYKIVNFKNISKEISQSDLYQILTYAIRFEIDKAILFYPCKINEDTEQEITLQIKDEFAGQNINITLYKLKIIDKDILKKTDGNRKSLTSLFEDLKEDLKNQLIDKICKINC